MKRKTALFLALIIPFLGIFAQGVEKGKGRWRSMTPEQKASSNANWMAKRLVLTETQKTQVKDANTEFYNSTKAAKDKYKGDSLKTQRKAALKAANETREAKLKTILTTEQYNKLAEIRKERKASKKQKAKARKEKSEEKNDDDGGEGDELED